MKRGELFLLPNLLHKGAPHDLFFPSSVDRAVRSLNGLIAESEKEARHYLKRFSVDFRNTPIRLLNKHTQEIDTLLQPLQTGEKWGLISDAGLPILADPGHLLVHRARELSIEVKVFVGPSSIVQALMLSGLPAQRFAFHGYLPKEPQSLLKKLEENSHQEQSTQMFIEAPYRNQKLLQTLLETLSDQTTLSVAWDLTSPHQGVETHPIATWKKRTLPNIHKKPAIFLLIRFR